jgi:hypothetical protein
MQKEALVTACADLMVGLLHRCRRINLKLASAKRSDLEHSMTGRWLRSLHADLPEIWTVIAQHLPETQLHARGEQVCQMCDAIACLDATFEDLS